MILFIERKVSKMKTNIRLEKFETVDYYSLTYQEDGYHCAKCYSAKEIEDILIAQITEQQARDEHSNNRMTKMHVYDVESMYPNINERKG